MLKIELCLRMIVGGSQVVIFKNKSVINAILIGVLCSISYLAVYFARNILSAVSPQMISDGVFTTEFVGSISSVYFIFYAVGQLINGAVGDRIKGRYMISFGLIFAGVLSVIFPYVTVNRPAVILVYGMTGFFLSMIYGPMTKIVAENTEPVHAIRCSLGYTFSSFFGSPLAGIVSVFLVWSGVFVSGGVTLVIMGTLCFVIFRILEKKGIVKYGQFDREDKKDGGIKLLIKHRIIKFTIVSMLTGIVRTTVVFWMPTYFSQYLGFSDEKAAGIFTVATFVISLTTFIAIFIYERLKRRMDVTLLLFFSSSAVSFILVYFVKVPVINIIFLVIGIMMSNAAATMLWSIYCPSLRDTGMVSGATGFLDFVSYMAAAASSVIFANAATVIGWGNLILVWFGLMVLGIVTALPCGEIRKKFIDIN